MKLDQWMWMRASVALMAAAATSMRLRQVNVPAVPQPAAAR